MWMRRSWSSWGLRLRRLIDDPICGSDFSPVARLAGCCRSPDMEISWQQDECIRDTDLGVCRFGGSIVICSRDTGLVDRNVVVLFLLMAIGMIPLALVLMIQHMRRKGSPENSSNRQWGSEL
jgi:hypothetical protein